MKKLEFLFYPTNPSEKNAGLKFVLFEVTTNEGTVLHDWGFAEWNGLEWLAVEAPEGYSVKVKWWANTLNPDLLIKEPGKIIKLP